MHQRLVSRRLTPHPRAKHAATSVAMARTRAPRAGTGACAWLLAAAAVAALAAAACLPFLPRGAADSRPPSSPALNTAPAVSNATAPTKAALASLASSGGFELSPFSSDLPLAVLVTPWAIPNDRKLQGRIIISGCSPSTPGSPRPPPNSTQQHPPEARPRCCLACELAPAHDSAVRVELRGRSSQAQDKKSYSVGLVAIRNSSSSGSGASPMQHHSSQQGDINSSTAHSNPTNSTSRGALPPPPPIPPPPLDPNVTAYGLSNDMAGSSEGWVDLPAGLLGMPADSAWVLYAPSLDRSLLRNAFAFDLSRAAGRWAPRYRFVELFVVDDGSTSLDTHKHYRGVYMLMERITRGRERVPISSVNASAWSAALQGKGTGAQGCSAGADTLPGGPDGGGFVVELANSVAEEWWARKLGKPQAAPLTTLGPTRVELRYPKEEATPQAALDCIAARLHGVHSALGVTMPGGATAAVTVSAVSSAVLPRTVGPFGNMASAAWGGSDAGAVAAAMAGLDLGSWVDYFLMIELSRDYDAYVSSVYLHQDGSGGLRAGPVWDKDLAYGNEAEVSGKEGWRYSDPETLNSAVLAQWYLALLRSAPFRAAVQARWHALREDSNGPWSDGAVHGVIDGLAWVLAGGAAARNFARWPLDKIWPNHQFVDLPQNKGSWEAEVAWLREWVDGRLAWLDGRVASSSYDSSASAGLWRTGRPPLRTFLEGR